jgi:nuclear-control-of-ATPase protein 2
LVNLGTTLVKTARELFETWLVNPLLEVWETVRRPESGIGVVDNAEVSLRADLDSLERMVTDFAADQGLQGEVLTKAGELARKGDMGIVQRAYEEEMRRPIKGVLGGDLVRTLLIQIRGFERGSIRPS